MSLIGETLRTSWDGPGDGRPFLLGIDVGIFSDEHRPPVVPDVVLGLDVQAPDDCWEKQGRSWFVWRYGPPLFAAEFVSAPDGGELAKLNG
ncbi:MAG TPA: hypothetical protein VGO93_18580 [Candidatus Xenobia bacterium]|jgi:hypothetical protein